jgi:hypothetical protein
MPHSVVVVVVLHETIHELHPKKLNGVIFKINLEKTYGKVKVMTSLDGLFFYKLYIWKVFLSKWIDWVKTFITSMSYQLM